MRKIPKESNYLKRLLKMKTILIFLLLPYLAFSQTKESDPYIAFSYAVDGRNLAVGSEPTNNKRELDGVVGFKFAGGSVPLEITLNYEHFKRIGCYKFEVGFGWIFRAGEKFIIIPSGGPTWIFRRGDVEEYFQINKEFFGAKVKLDIKYEVLPNFFIGNAGQYDFRGDLFTAGYKKHFVFSGYITFEYHIKLE